jgi:uncharacterized protein (TIGR03086 family)
MTAIADRYRRRADELTRRVEAVPPDRWDDPSPCAGWTARDVLRHIVESQQRVATNAGDTLSLARSVDDDPVAAWSEARAQMEALLDDADRAGREYDGLGGKTTIAKTVDTFIGFDLVIHGWDIARATGIDETIPPIDIAEASEFASSLGDNLHTEGVCGPEVPVPDDASDQDKLLGLLGRRP